MPGSCERHVQQRGVFWHATPPTVETARASVRHTDACHSQGQGTDREPPKLAHVRQPMTEVINPAWGFLARSKQGTGGLNPVRRTGQGTRWVWGLVRLGLSNNHGVMPAAFLFLFSQRQSGRAGRLARIASRAFALSLLRSGAVQNRRFGLLNKEINWGLRAASSDLISGVAAPLGAVTISLPPRRAGRFPGCLVHS